MMNPAWKCKKRYMSKIMAKFNKNKYIFPHPMDFSSGILRSAIFRQVETRVRFSCLEDKRKPRWRHVQGDSDGTINVKRRNEYLTTQSVKITSLSNYMSKLSNVTSGSDTLAPITSRYMAVAFARSGTAIAKWPWRPIAVKVACKNSHEHSHSHG